ncbi:MAG TPA: tetratricopeptide repeat protein, partial [Bacteroidia bacterium]|nr:tetratricopeptide repeat protein [Bacteroidia bacterium]
MQAQVTDSLQKLINGPGSNQQKQAWYHAITVFKSKTDAQGALQAAQNEYNFALKNKMPLAQVDALLMFCRIYLQSKNLVPADSVITMAEKLVLQTKDTQMRAQVILYKADIQSDRNEVAEAIQNYTKAFELFEKKLFYKGMAAAINRMALLEFKQGNFESAFKKDQLSFSYSQMTNDSMLMSNAVSNMGNYFYMKQQYDSALYYYNRTLLYMNKNATGRIAMVKSNVGDVLVELQKFKEALPYFIEAKDAFEKAGMVQQLSHLYTSLGRCYVGLKNYNEAETAFNQSLALEEENKDFSLIAENYGHLSDLAALLGNYKKAWEYQLKVEHAKDSLNQQMVNDEVLELQTRFETLQREKDNARLKAENAVHQAETQRQQVLIIALIVSVVLLALIGLMLFLISRQRQKNLAAQKILNDALTKSKKDVERLNNMLEIRAIRAQMDPHFIYNCMASALSLLNANRLADTEKYLVKFSRLLRMVLENAEYNAISLDKEIEMLTMYLDLESIRLNANFTYQINVDESLLEENIEV